MSQRDDARPSDQPSAAEHSDAAEWHYAQGATTVGPVPLFDLERAIREGLITAQTMVWTRGMGDWRSAGSISAFAPLFLEAGARPPTAVTPPMTRIAPPVSPVGSNFRRVVPLGMNRAAFLAGWFGFVACVPIIGVFSAIPAFVLGGSALAQIDRCAAQSGRGRALFGVLAGVLSFLFHIAVALQFLHR